MTTRQVLLGTLALLCLQSVVAPDHLPPVVLWFAPFLSGGGYSSEAISYLSALAKVQDAVRKTPESAATEVSTETPMTVDVKPFTLFATQHGDALNALFINTLPEETRQLLIDVPVDGFCLACGIGVDNALVSYVALDRRPRLSLAPAGQRHLGGCMSLGARCMVSSSVQNLAVSACRR